MDFFLLQLKAKSSLLIFALGLANARVTRRNAGPSSVVVDVDVDVGKGIDVFNAIQPRWSCSSN
jgi:hypothetical protein